jgi:hypothetical protein
MPGATFRDKKLASEAGKKSKPGKHAKTKQWEALGELISNELTGDVMDYIQSLPPEEKFKAYKDLLEYFKPKLQRSEIRAEIGELQSPTLNFKSLDETD